MQLVAESYADCLVDIRVDGYLLPSKCCCLYHAFHGCWCTQLRGEEGRGRVTHLSSSPA
jgi:hypothetical protein